MAKIKVPKIFNVCLDKYLNATKMNPYSLKLFSYETGLKVGTLLNRIKSLKDNKDNKEIETFK